MAVLSRGYDVDAVWPSSPADATAEAASAAEAGVEIVVAMGGDGMVHHVAQGLVGSDTSLGIIPVGTTNVVARLLGLPKRSTKAARLITSPHEPTLIGVATMTLTRGTTETVHHAVFACGFGLDAQVVIEADSDPYRKYRFGSLHYARTAVGVGVKTFPKVRPHLEVSAGDRSATGNTALLQFREVFTFFGRIPITLTTEPPDPMTALVLERLRRRRIPHIALNALSKRELSRVAEIEVWEAVKQLEVTADPPVAVQADGESLGMIDAAMVEWNADSLNVIAQSAL